MGVYWKGTLLTARDIAYGIKNNRGALYLLDKAAQQVTHEYGIPYINASDVLQYIPRFQEQNRMYEIYTKDRIHHGPIARSHDANKVGTVSMLVTQRILGAICPELINADPTLGMGTRAPPMIDTAKLAGNVPGMLGSLPAPKYDMNHGFGDQRQAGNMMNNVGMSNGGMNNGGMNNRGMNNGGMSNGGMNNNNPNGINNGNMFGGGGMNNGGAMTNNMMGNRFNTKMNSNGGLGGAKDFGTQRLEKVQAANARIANNQDALREDLTGGNLEVASGESRFAAIERQRCASGRCKKGYIEGTADDPNVNGRASSGNTGGQAGMSSIASSNNFNMNGDGRGSATTNSMDDRSSQNAMDMALGPGLSLNLKSSSTSDSSSGSSGDSSISSSSSGEEVPEWKKKQLAARAAFRAQNGLDADKIESKRKKKLDTTTAMTSGGIGLRRNRRRLRRHANENM